MAIYLIIHGQDLNPSSDRLSINDYSLSTEGENQANACGTKLKSLLGSDEIPYIVTSPRLRTKQTAKIVANNLGVDSAEIKVDERLKERNCAAYDGELIKEVFSKSETELVAGGIEPYSELKDRLLAAYNDINNFNQSIIIVTHSGNIKPLTELASGQNYVNQLNAEDFVRIE